MTKIFAPLAVAGLCASLAALPAFAADYAYDHNGSRMRLNVEGNKVRIFYEMPRSSLKSNGVKPGTLLFEGKVSKGYLEGMSRIFHSFCGEVDYFVYGDFSAGRDFKLNGAAPVLSGMSCRIVDNVYDGPNANLTFRSLGGGKPAQSHSVQSDGACVTGVRTTLNVRVGPGSDYGIVDELPAGSCGVAVLSRCQDNWCVVRQGNSTGWVSMKYIAR